MGEKESWDCWGDGTWEVTREHGGTGRECGHMRRRPTEPGKLSPEAHKHHLISPQDSTAGETEARGGEGMPEGTQSHLITNSQGFSEPTEQILRARVKEGRGQRATPSAAAEA